MIDFYPSGDWHRGRGARVFRAKRRGLFRVASGLVAEERALEALSEESSGKQPSTARRRFVWFSALGVTYLVISGLIGATTGLGAFTFYYAQGASYLTNDSAACANCHIMREQYDAWHQSSHGKFASCNDCHAPHDSLVNKYYCKGRNGFFHSLAFTTGWFHEPIRITEYNRRVTEEACRYCHQEIVSMIDAASLTGGEHAGANAEMSCIRCHDDVGHDTH